MKTRINWELTFSLFFLMLFSSFEPKELKEILFKDILLSIGILFSISLLIGWIFKIEEK